MTNENEIKPKMEILKATVSSDMEYAGFWRRFAAYIIDYILVFIMSFIIALIFGFMVVMEGGGVSEAEGVGFIIGFVISWLYWAVMESSPKQATLGKMALGIMVTDLKGNKISFGRATGRHFGKIISGLILLIGFIMVGFTRKKQGLHDIIAECLVVSSLKKEEKKINDCPNCGAKVKEGVNFCTQCGKKI